MVGQKLVPVASDDDLDKLLNTVRGHDFLSIRDRAIIALLADTGMRLTACTDIEVASPRGSQNGLPISRLVPMQEAGTLPSPVDPLALTLARPTALRRLFQSLRHARGVRSRCRSEEIQPALIDAVAPAGRNFAAYVPFLAEARECIIQSSSTGRAAVPHGPDMDRSRLG